METEAVGASSVGAEVRAEQPPVETKSRKKKKVMVAVDESDESFYALRWAVEFLFPSAMAAATTVALGSIIVVHVYQPYQHSVAAAGPGVYAPTGLVQSVKVNQEKNAEALLFRASEMCKNNAIKVKTLLLEGETKAMICKAAEEMHVDVLVVGSRGLGKIKRTFLGSVSGYCVHHAKCPVLIVKPPIEMTQTRTQ